jgi:2-polyprenyl-3-methyl-5-hydroxy-6-metoxy-1,4-benzoquinol methylase
VTDAERIIGLYDRHAEYWDRVRGRNLLEKTCLDKFLAQLRPGASILDIGCGSGEPISRYFIEKGFHVTGVDSSPNLIGICKSRFPHQNWIVADMRTLALGRRFEGILAWDSFFHLSPEDQRKMFSILQSHAEPGTTLMFTSGSSHGEAIGEFQGEALYHGSLDSSEYRLLLNNNGFDVLSHVVDDPTCGGHTVWFAQLSEGLQLT